MLLPLDFPAAAIALWNMTGTCGIRPEYVLPVMWVESGYQVGVKNRAGADQWGLIQVSGAWLKERGIAPESMAEWEASQAIERVVSPWLCEKVRQYGKLKSGVRVYQSLFYPASLRYAPRLSDTIVSSPAYGCEGDKRKTSAYCANRMFDKTGKGWITPGDLGTKIKEVLAVPDVADALRQTYAMRPGEAMQDPAYGGEYVAGWKPEGAKSAQLGDWASVFTIVAGAATTVALLHHHTSARATV